MAYSFLGYFKGIDLPDDVFLQDTLNDFIALVRRKTFMLSSPAQTALNIKLDRQQWYTIYQAATGIRLP